MPEYTDLTIRFGNTIRFDIQHRSASMQAMKEIISNLRADHKNITRLLQQLSDQAVLLANGDFINFQILADTMQYFTNYPDIYHHPHEEQIFKVLRTRAPETSGTIDRITAEHAQIAASGARMLDDIKQIQGNAIFSRKEFCGQLNAYINAYKTHIDTEENQLFQCAEKMLPSADWKLIALAIKSYEDPLFGATLVGEYQSLYETIMVQTATDSLIQ